MPSLLLRSVGRFLEVRGFEFVVGVSMRSMWLGEGGLRFLDLIEECGILVLRAEGKQEEFWTSQDWDP